MKIYHLKPLKINYLISLSIKFIFDVVALRLGPLSLFFPLFVRVSSEVFNFQFNWSLKLK